jgi:hypothetical protein
MESHRPNSTIQAVRRAFESNARWPVAATDPDRHYQGLAAVCGYVGLAADGAYALTDFGRRESGLTLDPVFSSKTGQQIGYIQGKGAYDLRGRKQFDVDDQKNLIDLESGKIVAHLTPAGKFTEGPNTVEEVFSQE